MVNLPIGTPIAKSLVCVQNIANNPARAVFVGLVTTTVIISTKKNIMVLDTKMANMNIQFTDERSIWHSEMNINEGSENLPTNVFNPDVSL